MYEKNLLPQFHSVPAISHNIQMPGMDGMETARILRQKNERMVLIFVTAVEEYVFQAFDVAAFHYLVKPFSDEKFEEVVKCAVRSIEKYSENQSDEKYMMVQSGGSHMKVFLKDIVYAEVYNRKVIIHTQYPSKTLSYGFLWTAPSCIFHPIDFQNIL